MPTDDSESHKLKQADKFRDAARELECDLDEEAFDRALGKIAKAPLDSESDATQNPENENSPSDS